MVSPSISRISSLPELLGSPSSASSSSDSSLPRVRQTGRARPVHLQTENYLRLLASKRLAGVPQLEPRSRLSRSVSTPPVPEEADEINTDSCSLVQLHSLRSPESISDKSEAHTENELMPLSPAVSDIQIDVLARVHAEKSSKTPEPEAEIIAEKSAVSLPAEKLPDSDNTPLLAPQPLSVNYMNTFRSFDIRERLEDIRKTLVDLQNSPDQFTRDRRRNSPPSIPSMTIVNGKNEVPIERSSQSSTTPAKRQSARKPAESAENDFFANLFADKVPKAKYDAARKRNQSLERQLYRHQVDFQRTQDRQNMLIKSLIKKQEQLQALIYPEDSPGLDAMSDSGVVMFRTGTSSTFHNNHADQDTMSEIDSPNQVSASAPKWPPGPPSESTRPLKNGRSATESNIKVDTHSSPLGRSNVLQSVDNDRFTLMLQVLRSTLRDELREELRAHRQTDSQELSQLLDTSTQTVLEKLDKLKEEKKPNNDLKEVLYKLKSLEKTQAVLAENTWRP